MIGFRLGPGRIGFRLGPGWIGFGLRLGPRLALDLDLGGSTLGYDLLGRIGFSLRPGMCCYGDSSL